jgi:3-hydroxyisobutyrate dehydrogenase-like beta-hydroxyacid dehydrogenase
LTKRQIAEQLGKLSQNYVDCAVLGAFSSLGYRVPMIVSGAKSEAFATFFRQYGMNIRVVGPSVGTASSIKMLRSIFVKGTEGLLLEMLVAADVLKVTDQVVESLNDFVISPFSRFADHMMTRDAIHAERRAHEMEEVIRTVEELKVDPIMSKATHERLAWSASLGLNNYFGGQLPVSFKEVLEAIHSKDTSV